MVAEVNKEQPSTRTVEAIVAALRSGAPGAPGAPVVFQGALEGGA